MPVAGLVQLMRRSAPLLLAQMRRRDLAPPPSLAAFARARRHHLGRRTSPSLCWQAQAATWTIVDAPYAVNDARAAVKHGGWAVGWRCLRGCALTRGVTATDSPRAVGREHGIIGVRCARQPCELRFTAENRRGVQQKREGARGDIQGDGRPRES
jgi:hypothetical protein